jgi:mannose-1-phosphate guanylyltransferase
LSKQVLEKSNTDYIDIIESTPKHRCGYCFWLCIRADDIFVLLSDHIIGAMELYEASIQEAIAKAANGFIVTWNHSLNLKQAMGISNAKG